MTPPLFLFGTLRHTPLFKAVLGDISHLTINPAVLRGFSVLSVAEGPFPMIQSDATAQAEGLCIVGLSDEDYAKLDYYEGAFGYSLKPVQLFDGTKAQVYFPPPATWTAQGKWNFDQWAAEWGQISILSANEVMQYRGIKTADEIAQMFPMIRARASSTVNATRSKHGVRTLPGHVEVTNKRRPYAQYFALDEFDLRHTKFDGSMSDTVTRAVFRAPDAALVLPYDPHTDRVLLVEQIRFGPFARGDQTLWQLEPVAGRLDAGEQPEQAARREMMEEAGLALKEMHPVGEVYCSPGTSSEFYYLYLGIADLPDLTTRIGGLAAEDEDIRSHVIGFEDLMQLCDRFEVANAPILILAFWLARHRGRLRTAAGK